MTIPNTARKAGPLLGTGSQTAWPFTFKVFAAGDVQVTIANSSGVETLLVLGTDYTVSLNANQETSPGGTVTYPISGSALPVGSVLAIIGDLDYDQPLDLPSGGNFSPTALENQLDRSTMQIQQLREEMNRTAKLPPTSSESVEALVDDLQRIADSADNLDTVAENITSVNVVAADLSEPVSEINTVATSIANVNTVGNNITNVNTVAGISANVTTVAGIQANVTTVAGIAADVTAVAGNAADISAVADNEVNIDAVAGNAANINTVAGNNTNITTVAGISANVTTVAGISADVQTVADNVADITNFADVYQGPKPSDPTLRNDGSALQAGDLYFNTVDNALRAYSGTVWVAGTAGTVNVQRFSGTGAQTAFTLASAPAGENNTQVYVGGVYQQKDQYSVSGTTLTFSSAPPSGTDNIEVVTIATLALGETDAALVSFLQAGTGAVERTSQAKLRDFVSVKDFGAAGDWNDNTHAGTDDTAAIQAAVNSGKAVYFPAGAYKTSSTIILPAGASIFGDGWGKTKVFAYGCDGFRLLANTNVVTVERMEISSYSALNVIDPKVWSGISCEGLAGQLCSWVTVRDVRMRGWGICVDWRYTWNSVIDNVDTSFCAQGARLFGQSVNNSINNSRLGANTGDYGINLQSDGATIGEGLMVSNSLIHSGAYGIYGNNGFLSLNVTNCVIDLITNKGVYVVDPRALMVSNCWIYAANRGIEFPPLGADVTLGAAITGNKIIVTGASAIPIHVNGANLGITITGGSLEAVNGNGVYVQGGNVTVAGVNIVTANANGINFDGGDGCVAIGNTGKNTVLYNNRALTSKQVLAASAIQFPVTQIASSDANTLDDYEEGTWTPLISVDGLGVSTFTSTSAIGSYVKIGRLVTVTCEYAYSARTSANSYAILTGLPFSFSNDGREPTFFVAIEQSAFDTKRYYAQLTSGVSLLFRYDNGSGALYNGAPWMIDLVFPSSGTVRFTMSYLASA